MEILARLVGRAYQYEVYVKKMEQVLSLIKNKVQTQNLLHH